MEAKEIDFAKIEKKWQKKWEERKIFEVKEGGKKKKFYCLEMFPYPSSSGLHMGHALNYTIGDIYARFKRMKGYNVLYPMGYDAFGLPAENAAIKVAIHPKKFTQDAINNFIKQQKGLGLSYDWSRLISTCEPEYYKWNQYFFLKFYENGFVYRKKAPVNFCRKCDTVLANEQVHNGKCWRHEDTDVEIKYLEQWFIRTTKYAEELLRDIEKLNWPERIKIMQRNWIGRSRGVEINFEIDKETWPIFTTRPDTIFGVTFMVISTQHPKLIELTDKKYKKQVEEFVEKCNKARTQEEIESLEKEGVFTGKYATNPLTNEKVPVYAGNFVLADYGCGMVMAVPAHDQRDFEFAKKYKIPIKIVIQPETYELNPKKMNRAFTGEGILVNSGKFDKTNSREAVELISDYIEEKKLGKRTLQYKLKDWLVSRQRYWGTPVPIIYCEKCGVVPVPEKQLPVLLPEKVKFGKGNPLETNKEFVNAKCPKCNLPGKRETDTMDTFFDSSWYFLRYTDNRNKKQAFDKKKVQYWMPVDQYIGGAEHACMHLIYARFFTKALRDLGFLSFNEPFTGLFNQGMLHGPDGVVMSKSRGNVVLPEEVSAKYGIDTARLFLISVSSPDKDILWSEEGIQGSFRFLKKVIDYFENVKLIKKIDSRVESKLNKTIKQVTEQIENFQYNLAIINIRDLFSSLPEQVGKETLEVFIKLLAPFCPHIAEELWHKIGNKSFVSLEKWPEYNEKKINSEFEKQEKAIEKLKEDINNIIKITGKKNPKIYVYVLPKELEIYEHTNIENISIFSVSDKKKYDPQNKAGKAKPGKPAIYIE